MRALGIRSKDFSSPGYMIASGLCENRFAFTHPGQSWRILVRPVLAGLCPPPIPVRALYRARRAGEFRIGLNGVPYPGAAPAVNALLGKHVIALITGISNVSEHLAAGSAATRSRTNRSAAHETDPTWTLAEPQAALPSFEGKDRTVGACYFHR